MTTELRSADPTVVGKALSALAPPFDAEVTRELVAIAYGHENAGLRKSAVKPNPMALPTVPVDVSGGGGRASLDAHWSRDSWPRRGSSV